MSNPVTNVEIEDVLSSIRRLVADGDQREDERSNTPEPPPSGEGGPLVLTQALRVEGGKTTTDHDDGLADTPDDPLAVARRVARLEAAVTVQNNEFEPDGSEEATLPDPAHESDIAPVFHSRTRAADAEVKGEADLTPRDEAPPTLPRPSGADTIGDADTDSSARPPLFLSPQLIAEPVTATPPEGATEDEETDQPPEGLFDVENLPEEEILRDLIAEILRDELAGALGERITRNVRKLVRREIFRILESQEQK